MKQGDSPSREVRSQREGMKHPDSPSRKVGSQREGLCS